jgi:hypothetical protein
VVEDCADVRSRVDIDPMLLDIGVINFGSIY